MGHHDRSVPDARRVTPLAIELTNEASIREAAGDEVGAVQRRDCR
ncbi:MAG: hypothetical protein WCQ77_03900 [Planctomycetota bacterium]